MHPTQVPVQTKQPPAPKPPPQPHPDAYQPKSAPPQEEEVGTQATIMPHSGVGLSTSPNRPKKMARKRMQYNEYLGSVLEPRAGGTTGVESPEKIGEGLVLYKDANGSYRFVKTVGDEPVSAIQVMSKDGESGQVAKAFTSKEHRRRGYASELIGAARNYFKTLTFSDDRSGSGDKFVGAVQEKMSRKKSSFTVKPPKVLYRGMVSDGSGLGTYQLGKGVYSSRSKSFLNNFAFDKIVTLDPELYFPRNPLVLGHPSELADWLLRESGLPNMREFNKKYKDPGEFVSGRGFDGVVAGDEVVKYNGPHFKWDTIGGKHYEGDLVDTDNDTAIVRLSDGTEKATGLPEQMRRYARIGGLKKIVSGHYQYVHGGSGKKFIITRDVMRNGKTTWLVHKQNGPTPDHYGHPFDAGGSLEEAVSYCKPDEEMPSKKRRYERPRLFFLRGDPARYAADDLDFSMMGAPGDDGGGDGENGGGGDPYERPLPPEVQDAVRHQVGQMIGSNSRGVQDVDHRQFVNELSQKQGPHPVGFVMTTQYLPGKQLRSGAAFPEFNGAEHPGVVHKVVRGTGLVNVKYDDAMLRSLVRSGKLPEEVLPMVGKKTLQEINSWLDSKGVANPFEPGKTWSRASLDQQKAPKLTPFSHHESDPARQHYMRVSHVKPISEEYYNFQGQPLDFETEVAPFMTDRAVAREGGVGFRLFRPGNVHAVKVGGHVLLKAPFLHTGIKEEGGGEHGVERMQRLGDLFRFASRKPRGYWEQSNGPEGETHTWIPGEKPVPAESPAWSLTHGPQGETWSATPKKGDFESQVAAASKEAQQRPVTAPPITPVTPALTMTGSADESPITVDRSPRPGMQTTKDVAKSVGGVKPGPSRDLRVAMLANGYGKEDVERAARVVGHLSAGGHSVLNGNQRDLEIAKQLRDLGLAQFHAVTAGGKLQNIYVARTREHAKALADAHVEDHRLLNAIWKAVRKNIWNETRRLYTDADLHDPRKSAEVWSYATRQGARARAAGATGRTLDEQAKDVIARMRERAGYHPQTEVGQRLTGTGGLKFRRRYGRVSPRIAARIRDILNGNSRTTSVGMKPQGRNSDGKIYRTGGTFTEGGKILPGSPKSKAPEGGMITREGGMGLKP